MVMPSMRRVGEATEPRKTRSFADGGDVHEHFTQVAGNSDFLDGVSELAVLDPQSGGAPE